MGKSDGMPLCEQCGSSKSVVQTTKPTVYNATHMSTIYECETCRRYWRLLEEIYASESDAMGPNPFTED